MVSLAGKNVVVTGGSRGLGRAIAEAAAAQGAQVCACSRSGPVRADVTTEEGVARLVEECGERLGSVDVLVNNVGVDGHRPLGELDAAEWTRVLDANLTSGYAVIRGLLPLLSDGASIVNVGASAALRGRPASAHYTASKAALVGMTKSLSRELACRGIRVNVVSPGVLEDEDKPGPPPHVRERVLAAVPMGRFAAYADVVGPVLFLASDSAAYVTGQNLLVDGGM